MNIARQVFIWLLPFLIVVGVPLVIAAVALEIHEENRDGSKPGYHPFIDKMPAWGGIVIAGFALCVGVRCDDDTLTASLMLCCALFAACQGPLSDWASDWVLSINTGAFAGFCVVTAFRTWNPLVAAATSLALIGVVCTFIGFFHLAARLPGLRSKAASIEQARDLQAAHRFVEGLSRDVGAKLELVKFVRGHRGLEFTITCVSRGATWLCGQVVAIAIRAGVHVRQIEARPSDAGESTALINVNTTDTLATMAVWKPSPDTTIIEPILLGLDYKKQPIEMLLSDMHWCFTGTTGSGKSMGLRIPMACVAQAQDADLWVIEASKHGQDFAPFERQAKVWADTPNKALAALTLLLKVADERYAWLKRTGNEEAGWPTSALCPRIVVFIDEVVNLTRNKAIETKLMDAIGTVRGAGINIIMGAVRPEGRILDTNIRSQIMGWVVFNVDSDRTMGLAIPNFPNLPIPAPKGYINVYEPTMKYPVFGRTWHIIPESISRYARSLAEPGPSLYPVPPELMPGAIGSDFPVRPQVIDVAGATATSANGVEVDVKGRTLLDVLMVDGGVVSQAEIKRRTEDLPTDLKLGNERTIQAKAAVLVDRGFAVAHTSTSWSVADAGREWLAEREVKA